VKPIAVRRTNKINRKTSRRMVVTSILNRFGKMDSPDYPESPDFLASIPGIPFKGLRFRKT
jgi:hypothetical protein